MKNLTIKELIQITEKVFITFDLGKNFQLLTTKDGETFDNLGNAIDFVRSTEMVHLQHIGLSGFEGAKSGHCEWDNI